MNPDEELPPEIARRGYYHQPVWKRIVVISRGAGDEPPGRVRDPVRTLVRRQRADPERRRNRDRVAGREQLRRGDEVIAVDGREGDQAGDRRDAVNEPRVRGRASGTGARADTPASVEHRARRTDPRSSRSPREYDAGRVGQAAARVHLRDPRREPLSRRGRAHLGRCHVAASPARRSSVVARLFDPQQREQISGVVGGYEMTRQSIEFDARRALTLIAMISLSLAIINLFPFLPLDGGHIFWSLVEKVRGPAGPVQRHGARRGDRLRARDAAVLHRVDERHRPAERGRLQRPVAEEPRDGGREAESRRGIDLEEVRVMGITTAERYASGGPARELVAAEPRAGLAGDGGAAADDVGDPGAPTTRTRRPGRSCASRSTRIAGGLAALGRGEGGHRRAADGQPDRVHSGRPRGGVARRGAVLRSTRPDARADPVCAHGRGRTGRRSSRRRSLPRLLEAKQGLPELEHVVVVDGEGGTGDTRRPGGDRSRFRPDGDRRRAAAATIC